MLEGAGQFMNATNRRNAGLWEREMPPINKAVKKGSVRVIC
jgi:hypothetical protein